MANFCGKCGTELDEKGLCPNCDKDIINKKSKSSKIKALAVILFIVLLISCTTGVFVVYSKNYRDNDENNSGISSSSSITDDTGNKISSNKETSTLPTSSEKYDKILAEGDGYYLVSKFEQTYNSAETKIGIIDSKNEWLLELSADNIFADAHKSEAGKTTLNGGSTYLTYEYLGDGIFIGTLGVDIMKPGLDCSEEIGGFRSAGNSGQECYFYNVTNSQSWHFAANYISSYDNEYMLVSNYGSVGTESKSYGMEDWYFIVDQMGNIKDINLERQGAFSPLSDGLFLNGSTFYNLEGNPVLDLYDYDLTNASSCCFIDGECEIRFKNPAGNEYIATIGKNGEFIKAPQPIND